MIAVKEALFIDGAILPLISLIIIITAIIWAVKQRDKEGENKPVD